MAEIANDVKDTVIADTTTTETSTDENSASIDESTDDELVFDLDELDEETESESSDKEPSPETESKPAEPDDKSNRAEQRKQQLNTQIRDLVAEKNALERSVAELNRQKYQIASKDDLPTVEELMTKVNEDTGAYFTRTEAQLLLLQAQMELGEQERQLDAYNKQIVDNTIALKEEIGQTLKDFPMFDEKSDQYDKELAAAANNILNASLEHDPRTGRIIGCRISPYELYSAIANAVSAGKTQGEVASRKATQKMMQSVDTIGNAPTGKTEEKDDFLSGLLG